eukprot:TRINITY_DN12746_c0_g1_i1.p1 TRINITY_DN12746_c0_g1~~TRINITY_DN12746_c0_g1_i1.p1  ORF type:complete len:828 (-),score=287.41 TRINITY_DN12746_c0_g1_i1:106-2376(-)
MFGFIAPLRNSENVFFHISEVMAEDPDYLPRQNDEVAFDIQEGRDGRLSAVNIDILPPGTIVVEEFSKQTFEGKIVDLPVLNKKSGLIEYESSENMPPKEIQFIDTDLHKDFKGHKFEVGDIIRFFTVHNLRTDQTYAAEIKIIKSREDIEREFLDMSLSSNPDKRRGIVTSVSDQGGKIQAIGEEQEIRFFPSFVQKDETKKKKSGDIRSRGLGLKVDDEVEFFLIKDTERYFNTKNGLVAVEVKKLPKGSVVSTMQISKRVFGRVIDAGSNSSGGRFFGKKQKHRKNGMVEVHLPQSLAEEYGISGGVVEKRIEPTEKINEPLVKAIVEYRAKDLDEPNMILCIGDLIAAELLLVQPFGDLIVSELKLYDFEGTYGFIEAINENRRSGELFGFIKTLDDRSIYFSERDLIDDTTLTVKFIEKQQKVPTKDDRHVIETPELVEGTHVCFKEISIEEQLAQQQNRFGGRGFDRDREDRDRDDGRAKRETKPKAVNVRLLPRGYIDTKKILFEDVEGVVVCVKEEKMVRVFNPTKSLLPLKPSFIGPSRADQNMVPDIVTVPSLPTGALLGSVVSISATAERDVAPRRGGFNRNFNRDNMHNNRRYNNNNNGNVEITTTLIQSQPLREVGRTVAAQGFILPYVSQKIHVDKFLNKHKQRHFSFVRGVANRMNGRLKWTVNSIKEAKVDISLFHEVQLNDDGTPAVFSGEVLDHDFSVKIWPQGMSPEDAPSATVKYMSKVCINLNASGGNSGGRLQL